MATRPRGYALTPKGEAAVELIRSGAWPVDANDKPGPTRPVQQSRPTCSVCGWWPDVTPRGFARFHMLAGAECPGTGLRVVTE